MNCLNISSVGIGAGAAIGRAIGTGAEISSVGVAPGLIDGGAEVFTLVEVEMLERKILREPRVDLIGSTSASLLAML